MTLGGLGTAGLAGLHRREQQAASRMRASFFADCLGQFSAYQIARTGSGYPILEGRYGNFPVRLEPVLDSIAPRKLPSLWLKVTMLGPVRYRGVFDFLRRPQGTEFYSPAGELDHRVAVPPGWPQDSQIASDAPALMPPVELMARHLPLFEDPRAKEMLVTKAGVRIVYQVSQAERARYAVLRQAVFPENRLRAELAAKLLRAVAELHQTVAA